MAWAEEATTTSAATTVRCRQKRRVCRSEAAPAVRR
jgi:hypothetical protein